MLTYALMLDSLLFAYAKFVIMLIQLQKVLSQEIMCLCSAPSQTCGNEPKTVLVSLLHFKWVRHK